MAQEEKVGGEATETDQSADTTESYDATRQSAGEYLDYHLAPDLVHFTAEELYDTAPAKAGEFDATTREGADAISAAVEAGKRAYAEAQRLTARELNRLVDATGKPIERHEEWRGGALGHATPEGFVNFTISRGEFDRLSTKTREVLTEAALAQERIAKDQEEIDLFKTETREVLRRLRAA